jgi:hypothetical protein
VVFREFLLIILLARKHCLNVIARHPEGNLPNEQFAVGARRAFVPSKNVGAPGVVIGQRVRNRIVGICVAPEQLAQIPRAGLSVLCRIEELRMHKEHEAFGFGPFLGGFGANLHQTDFAGGAFRARIEAAFAPDNGLDERAVDTILAGGGEDVLVLAVLLVSAPALEETQGATHGDDSEQPPFPAFDLVD